MSVRHGLICFIISKPKASYSFVHGDGNDEELTRSSLRMRPPSCFFRTKIEMFNFPGLRLEKAFIQNFLTTTSVSGKDIYQLFLLRVWWFYLFVVTRFHLEFCKCICWCIQICINHDTKRKFRIFLCIVLMYFFKRAPAFIYIIKVLRFNHFYCFEKYKQTYCKFCSYKTFHVRNFYFHVNIYTIWDIYIGLVVYYLVGLKSTHLVS